MAPGMSQSICRLARSSSGCTVTDASGFFRVVCSLMNEMFTPAAERNRIRPWILVATLTVLIPFGLPAAEYLPWRAYVSNCIETLIQDGTDRYGPVPTDMLMSIIDVRT